MLTSPIIQGGMGVGVSNWRLARAVARAGQTGVVSGTALDVVFARRLQLGDVGGDLRRALANFPFRDMAQRVLDRFFVEGGKCADAPFRTTPMPSPHPDARARELLVVANFAEVFLAREAHDRPVGVNYLEKLQLPTLPAVYGALLAGVGCVIMGAGIPRSIPGALDRLAAGLPARLPYFVQEAGAAPLRETTFDPREFCGGQPPVLARPDFLPIVSSATLADMLHRKSNGRIDGFIVEGASAGGHNAPPRGQMRLDSEGEPIYGERDRIDVAAIRDIGLPFWVAGSQATAERLHEALAAGASGIQVGTAFAFCEESGIAPELKRRVLDAVRAGNARVRTKPLASPAGLPFKVLDLAGTLGDPAVVAARERICDLGYLRRAVACDDAALTWRCPAEPEADYVRKGGTPEDTVDRLCVCNGLLATIGLGQVRGPGVVEPPLVTSGDEIGGILRFVRPDADSYTAADVLDVLLA
jgi:nitronate monooxygenase